MTEATLIPPLLVNRDDDLPVGVQLAWELRALIATGKLGPGERLPGLREIAERAGVNVNTARAVYARLERDGLLVSRQGLGTFVAESAAGSADIGRLTASAIEKARDAEVDPLELARAIFASELGASGPDAGEGTGLPDVGRAADEAAARRELRRQIGRLEAQLASYPEARSEEETHPLLRPKAHVAGVGELEAVRDQLMERLKAARAEAERRGERQSRARARREGMISRPRGAPLAAGRPRGGR